MTSTRTRPTPNSVAPRRVRPRPAGAESSGDVTELQAGPLTIEVTLINATLAASMMLHNASNRSIRKKKIQDYKRDMVAGNWLPIGDPLRWDTDGKMIDGQHRLLAVIAADEEEPGIEFLFIVVRGVQPEARRAIDTGTKRTAGDQLKMAGYKNHLLLAAAAKWAVIWDRRGTSEGEGVAGKSVTHPEILSYVEDHPDLLNCTAIVSNRMIKHVDMPGGYIAVAYYLIRRVDPDLADEFFDRLVDGVGLPAADPILALRRRLRDLDKQRANLSGEMWLGLLVRTWNARREGRTMRGLPVYKGNEPIPCPEIK